jgi:spermidine synthase
MVGRGGSRAGGPFWTGFGVIFACFFLSGATGLIYQVLWLRLLGLVFGHTVYAITAVLAAFMAGLALGSFIFARLAGRLRNLIQAYGWLEIGIGVYCALLPLLLWLTSLAYLWAHRAFALSYGTFSLIQFLLVFCLLLVPTTLMGGTLPVLSQALAAHRGGFGRIVGALYAVNTFGAVLGVILAGYLLLPAFGNRITIAIAASANLAVGVLALVYGRGRRVAAPGPEAAPAAGPAGLPQGEPRGASPDRAASPDEEAEPAAPLAVWLTVAALGVSGAVSMVYEVAWTRALALVIGSSTYAFTAMLVAFLVGIAGGSALYSWLWGARPASAATFGMIQAGIGLAVTVVLLIFERMPEAFLLALGWSDAPGFIQLVQFVVSASALLLFTLLIGATFPCTVAVAARAARRVGRDVGQVYAVNTLGAIAGTVVAGFLLLPALGVQGAVKLGIALNFLVAGVLLAAPGAGAAAWQWARLGGAVAVAVAVFLLPGWNLSVMTSGPAIYGKEYLKASNRARLRDILGAQQVIFYRDGTSGTVSVMKGGEHVFLRVNGKLDAGTSIDMATQLMSGHIPMLLHPDPRSVLVIGMGSGITAGAVARYPVERLDIVEIEPAVVQASRFFAHVHGDVLEDPRARAVIADGRNYLLTTPERYDVIISEPSNPWIGGLASLFSVEFFEMARGRLRPDGIMLQWLQGYSIRPDDFRMVLNTFRTVFPAVSIWNTITGDFLLVGRAAPVPVDLERIRTRYERNPGVLRDLRRIGIMAWPGVLGYFMLGEGDVARLTRGAGLNTDDRLPLEFSAPRALYLETTRPNWTMVRGFRTAPLPDIAPESRHYLDQPPVMHAIGVGYGRRGMFADSLPHFERALELDPRYRPAMVGGATANLQVGRPQVALELAQRALAGEPQNGAALFLAGLASEAVQARDQALAYLQRAVALDPRNREYQLALQRVSTGGPPPGASPPGGVPPSLPGGSPGASPGALVPDGGAWPVLGAPLSR